jgi:hypothetical protein
MEPRLIGERVIGQDLPARPPRLCDYGKSSAGDEVECVFGIDVRRWQRSGLLCRETVFLSHWLIQPAALASVLVRVNSSDGLHLGYRIRVPGRRWEIIDLPVRLVWTSCNYGGRRVWFSCPGSVCDRRVAVLYLGGRNRKFFGCRRCAGLLGVARRPQQFRQRHIFYADSSRLDLIALVQCFLRQRKKARSAFEANRACFHSLRTRIAIYIYLTTRCLTLQ